MKRTAPTVSLKESSGNISIKFPFNNPFAARYLGGVPPSPDRVTIQQVHLGDSTAELNPLWSGSVSSVKFAGTEATVSLAGVMNVLTSQIPTQTYSWMCDHNLYGTQCRVTESAFTFSFSVVSLSSDGVTVTLSDTGLAQAELSSDVSFFNGGTFLTGVDGSQRMGVKFEATGGTNEYSLVLLVPLAGLAAGQAITFTAGCDKSIDVCLSRFNNVDNYGGFPYVPTLNPFTADAKLTKVR
jgi:uncharacterized phage protein (TIGR02218 family)